MGIFTGVNRFSAIRRIPWTITDEDAIEMVSYITTRCQRCPFGSHEIGQVSIYDSPNPNCQDLLHIMILILITFQLPSLKAELWKIRTDFLQGIIERETSYRAAFEGLGVSLPLDLRISQTCVHTTADETA